MVQDQVVIDDDDDDEYEPLFSYDRVCKPPSDDDMDEDVAIVDGKTLWKKGGGSSRPLLLKPTCPSHKREIEDVTKGVEDDDDWLPPPPKSAKIFLESRINEDPTVRQIRQEREELIRFAASLEASSKKLEEEMKAQKPESQLPEKFGNAADEHASASANREKVLVTIQNKDGSCKSFRVFKDEKFEKLFTKYAETINVPAQHLVFLFDGEKVLGHNTPKDMDIEDEDIIEVNVRK